MEALDTFTVCVRGWLSVNSQVVNIGYSSEKYEQV